MPPSAASRSHSVAQADYITLHVRWRDMFNAKTLKKRRTALAHHQFARAAASTISSAEAIRIGRVQAPRSMSLKKNPVPKTIRS